MIAIFQLVSISGKSCGWLVVATINVFVQLFLAFHKHGVLLLVVENVCRDNITHLEISLL